jgi:hypothetical protein
MKEFCTEYANAADDGAPYVGPIVLAVDHAEARALVHVHLRGPNGEELRVRGEIVHREVADVLGDTKTWLAPED